MFKSLIDALIPEADAPTLEHLKNSLDLQIGLALSVRDDGLCLVDEWFAMEDRDKAESDAIIHFATRMRQAMGESNTHTHKFSITLEGEVVTIKYVFRAMDDTFPTIRRVFNRKFRPDRES